MAANGDYCRQRAHSMLVIFAKKNRKEIELY